MSTYGSQTTISSIEQAVLLQVVLHGKPLGLELSPQGFGQVEVRRVRWQQPQVKASLLPVINSFFYPLASMNSGTIQYQESRSFDAKRETFELLNNESRVNAFSSSGPIAFIRAADEAKAVQAGAFTAGNEDIFTRKLPAIGHLSFLAYMAFIAVEKVNVSFLGQLFQFMKAFKFVSLPLRARLLGRPSAYAPDLIPRSWATVSSAKTFKNRPSVSLDTFGPPSASNSALAVNSRCRLAFTAATTGAASLAQFSLALRPRPGLVNNPSRPSSWYPDNQLLTLISHMPTIEPTSAQVRPWLRYGPVP